MALVARLSLGFIIIIETPIPHFLIETPIPHFLHLCLIYWLYRLEGSDGSKWFRRFGGSFE